MNGKDYCCFCGKELLSRYDDCEKYFYCDCDDYKTDIETDEKISRLMLFRPQPKFFIETVSNLRRIK